MATAMKGNAMEYLAAIHKDADSDFGVSFPDLPGCVTAGRTLDEARIMAVEALTGHLELLREQGQPIPPAHTLDVVLRRADVRAHKPMVWIAINVAEVDKSVRLNITLPTSLLHRIDARVGAGSRSGFLAKAARQALA